MRVACATLILSLAACGAGANRTTSAASPEAASERAAAASNERTTRAASLVPGLAEIEAQAEALQRDLDALQKLRFVGMDDGPVPEFEITSRNGTEFASSRLVGERPFVIAFFATWCEACTTKLQSLDRAMRQQESMLVIPVSVDGPETRTGVTRYLRDVGRHEPAVFAADYPLFTFAYNPFNTVPLLVIVGRNGGLVDYQLGYDPEHERRLAASLKLAHTIGPLAEPTSTSRLDLVESP